MRPCNQGHLDCMCGPYSIINGVRLITNNCEIRNVDQSEKLFLYLLKTLREKRLLYRVLTRGTSKPMLVSLLDETRVWVSKELGVQMNYSIPFHRLTNVPARYVRESITQHLSERNTSVIARVIRPYDHWTVISASRQKQFVLADSDGLSHIAHRNWGTIKGQVSKRYLISPTGIFHISAGPDAR